MFLLGIHVCIYNVWTPFNTHDKDECDQVLLIGIHKLYVFLSISHISESRYKLNTLRNLNKSQFLWRTLTWRTFIPGKSEKSHVSLISLGAWQTRLSGDSWTMKDHIINYHQVAIRSLFLYSDICLLIKSCCYNIKLISITTLISELPQHCVLLVQVVNMKVKYTIKRMIKNHPNLVSPDILGPRVSPSGLEVPRLPSVPWVLSVRWLHCYLYKTNVSFIPNDQKVIRLALITFHELDLVAVYYTQRTNYFKILLIIH